MANIEPIADLQTFLAAGDIATARTAIGMGSVDNTSDLAKPISTATEAVTDAITARDWVRLGNNSKAAADAPSTYASDVESVMYCNDQALLWPGLVGTLRHEHRMWNNNLNFVTQTFTQISGGDLQIYSRIGRQTGDTWTDWKMSVQSTDGEILDQIQLPNQLATDDDSAMTRSLGDARYSAATATEIFVTSASQLSGTLDSSMVYIIDGSIDMGSTQINVPAGGLSIKSTNAIGVSLTSTANNYTMFVDASGDAGNLIIERIRFTVSGTASKVFDVTTNALGSVFSIDTPLFIACTEIGTLNGFAVLQFDTMQDISCSDGLTIDGAVTLLTIEDGASSGMASGGTLFKQGASLVISNNCAITRNTFIITSGATLCDFDAANFALDAGFGLSGNNISGGGSYFSNIDGSDVKCRWRDNNFDPATAETNTYVGSAWECTTAIATVATSGTDIKVAGTTTYNNEAWFSSATDNEFVYDSMRSVPMQINGIISITGTNGHEIQLTLRKWDDSLSSYSDIQIIPKQEMSSSGSPVNIPVLGFVTLDSPLDRIELWGQNVNNTANFTMNLNSILTVTERPH